MLIIHQRGRPGVPGDVDLRAKGAGKSGGDFTDARFHVLLHFCAVRAQRTLQLNAFRQHVPGIPPGDARHAQNNRIQRVDVTAGNALQRGHQLACQHDGVVAFMGTCGMRAFAGYVNNEAIDVGIERPPRVANSPTGSEGSLCIPKIARTSRNAPARTMLFAPPKVLFGWLKQDPHATVKRGFPLFQL